MGRIISLPFFLIITMSKIAQKLLAVSFPTLNIETLMEIVNATPNPQVATEILCGLYEEPEIPNKLVDSKGSEGILTFDSYDKWKDNVHYSYTREITKDGYFPEGTKVEDLTEENFKSLQVNHNTKDCVWLRMPTGKTEQRTSYMSLSRWLDLKAV